MGGSQVRVAHTEYTAELARSLRGHIDCSDKGLVYLPEGKFQTIHVAICVWLRTASIPSHDSASFFFQISRSSEALVYQPIAGQALPASAAIGVCTQRRCFGSREVRVLRRRTAWTQML